MSTTVDISLTDCITIDIISAEKITILHCEDCTKLLTIPDILVNLKHLYCKGTYLRTIPTLINLTLLNVGRCISLTAIPTLPNLISLNCWGCTSLTNIPTLPNLNSLNCWGCTSLTSIPTLPNLNSLNCWGCTSLTSIPNTLTLLKSLNCGGLVCLIDSIPNTLTLLEKLNYGGCERLTTIPTLSNLVELKIKACPGLTTIPTLVNLIELDCQRCTNLTTISTLPNLMSLNCWGCTSLSVIPDTLTRLRTLYCENCTSLVSIPLYHIERFNCSGCLWLEKCIGRIEMNIKKKLLCKTQRISKKWLKNFKRIRTQNRQSNFVDELTEIAWNPDRLKWLGFEKYLS